MLDKKKKNTIIYEYTPIAITAIGIIVCAIIFKQTLVKTLPVLFSLLIMLFNSRANRIGFLLGALNSVIYIIGYLQEGVYGTAASTGFGIIMALTAYFCWKKKSYGKATIFRGFSLSGRLLLTALISIAWVISSFVLWKMGGTAVVMDGLVLVLGILVPILNVWAFLEAALLNVLSCTLQLVMWIVIIITNRSLANLTYLIYMTYATYMVGRMFLRWVALYREQRTGKQENLESEKLNDIKG